MKSKKGFTLIELLAVIVVLGIIMLIAVTAVSNYISTSKVNAFLLDEKMFVKATQKYLAAGVVNYPSNIGDTVEVRLSDLQSNGFIERIKSPSNQSIECEGYLIVTKIEVGKYDYTPHLDCLNGIGSASEDGLLAHYTFDDFQEPTTNLISNNSFESGNANGWNIGNANSGIVEIDSINSLFGTKSLKVTVSNGGDQYQYATHNYGTSIAGRFFTVSAWIKTNNITGSGVNIATYWQNSTGDLIWSNMSNSSYITGNSNWIRLTVTGVAPTNAYQTVIIIYPDLKNGQGTYWIDGVQIEEKNYPTTFTETSRIGVVKDYSGNGKSSSLDVNITPKWTSNGKYDSGSYEFNGSMKYIELFSNTELLLGQNPNEWSYGFWFKKGTSHSKKEFLSNYSDEVSTDNLVGIWAGINNSADGRIFINVRGSGAPDYLYTPTGYDYNDNQWHHLFATVKKGGYVKGYIDGKEFASGTIGTADYIDNSVLRVGALKVNGLISEILDGSIDDIRIYNRELSNNEILQLYNATK